MSESQQQPNYLVEAWNGIATGKLKHNQEYYSCGTAMCLAGWAAALECQALKGEDSYQEIIRQGVKLEGKDSWTRCIKLTVSAGRNGVAHFIGKEVMQESPKAVVEDLWGYCIDKYSVPSRFGSNLFGSASSLLTQYQAMNYIFGEKYDIKVPPSVQKLL